MKGHPAGARMACGAQRVRALGVRRVACRPAPACGFPFIERDFLL